MKRFALATAFLVIGATAAFALPAKIISGQMLLGGTAYNTPDYQTYMQFSLRARTEMPRREYVMAGLQAFSVYLNHPIQPNGDFDYRVVMPYGPQRLTINGELFAPVWFEDCEWKIKSSMLTPEPTVDSPQFLTVSAPFTMSGSTFYFGNYSTGFKTVGKGTLQIKFEKIDRKYFMREALYIFGEPAPPENIPDIDG